MDELPPFDTKARAGIWYLLVDSFGDVGYDPSLGEPHWGPEWDVLEERTRRTLGRFRLFNSGRPPLAIRSFLEGPATSAELFQLLSILPDVVFDTSVDNGRTSSASAARAVTMKKIEDLLFANGIDAGFDAAGVLTTSMGTDAAVKRLDALPGRRAFEQDVAASFGRAELFSLVFVDLDNFKKVNDKNGHPAGDKCLADVADLLGTVVLRRGRLYRYGGDEFGVLLVNATIAEARATAERMRRAVDDAAPGGDVKVTASIGVVEAWGFSTSQGVIEAADSAAAASKALGRNITSTWPLDAQGTERLREYRDSAKGRG